MPTGARKTFVRKSLVSRGSGIDKYALERDDFARRNVYDPLYSTPKMNPKPKEKVVVFVSKPKPQPRPRKLKSNKNKF